MRETITPDDESKPVVDATGERVGRVVSVDDGVASVDPDPGLTETFLSMLGWAEPQGDNYALQSAAVEEITETEIRLKEF